MINFIGVELGSRPLISADGAANPVNGACKENVTLLVCGPAQLVGPELRVAFSGHQRLRAGSATMLLPVGFSPTI